MLNIVKGATEAHIYFSKENYYSKEDAIEHSRWEGEGAKHLGLKGQVDPRIFQQMLNGEVDGVELGRIVQGKKKHRSGWDLTFSAPKSLSILSEVYGMTELREIHEQAVSHALKEAEKLVDTRLTHAGKTKRVATGNAIFANFTHDVNRNLDCQLHTHCYLLNMTKTSNGWRSLSTERLFDSQRSLQLGLTYRFALAKLLKDAGFKLAQHQKPELFEIDGVPKPLLEEFSTRSKEIMDWFKSNKVPYEPTIAKTVALMSRKQKRKIERTELHTIWHERAKPYNFNPISIKKALDKSLPKSEESKPSNSEPRNKEFENKKPSNNSQKNPKNEKITALDKETKKEAKIAVKKALNHLTERDMAFTDKELIKSAFSFSIGNLLHGDIHSEIERLKKNQSIQLARDHVDKKSTPLWTTKSMKALESLMIDILGSGMNTKKPLVKPEYAQKVLKKSILNEQQKQAIVSALQSHDRYYAIQGDPGVGKTTALNEYRKILFKKGYEVLAMAPSYQAVDELSKSLNIKGMTVDRYLADPSSKKLGRPFKQQVWIIDESSMLATDRIVNIMQLAEERDARILFVGDHQQLEAVGAGRGFKQLQEAGIKTSLLNQWMRPKTEVTKEVFKHVMQKNYYKTIQTLSMHQCVHSIKNESEAIDAIADHWVNLDKKSKKETITIAPTNEQCDEISKSIRYKLQSLNEIDATNNKYLVFRDKYMTTEEIKTAKSYKKKDVLRFSQEHLLNKDGKKYVISKNEYFTVENLNPNTNTLALRSRKDRKLIYIDPKITGGNRPGGIQVFNEREIQISKGDKLRWIDNKNEHGLKRNTELTVIRSSKNWIRVKKEDDKSLKLEITDLKQRHFTYNYAKTAYGAQGETKKQVIALMNSWRKNTTHDRSFMVALTRASENIQLYTDSTRKLINSLKNHSGNNTEALSEKEFQNVVRASLQQDIPSLVPKPKLSRALI